MAWYDSDVIRTPSIDRVVWAQIYIPFITLTSSPPLTFLLPRLFFRKEKKKEKKERAPSLSLLEEGGRYGQVQCNGGRCFDVRHSGAFHCAGSGEIPSRFSSNFSDEVSGEFSIPVSTRIAPGVAGSIPSQDTHFLAGHFTCTFLLITPFSSCLRPLSSCLRPLCNWSRLTWYWYCHYTFFFN